jgi:hypothetical protein
LLHPRTRPAPLARLQTGWGAPIARGRIARRAAERAPGRRSAAPGRRTTSLLKVDARSIINKKLIKIKPIFFPQSDFFFRFYRLAVWILLRKANPPAAALPPRIRPRVARTPAWPARVPGAGRCAASTDLVRTVRTPASTTNVGSAARSVSPSVAGLVLVAPPE